MAAFVVMARDPVWSISLAVVGVVLLLGLELSGLARRSKDATVSGARRAASVAAQALARQRRCGNLGLLAP